MFQVFLPCGYEWGSGPHTPCRQPMLFYPVGRACDLIFKYNHCSNMKVTQQHMARGNKRFKTLLYIIYIIRIYSLLLLNQYSEPQLCF